jgi:hypothetical protein
MRRRSKDLRQRASESVLALANLARRVVFGATSGGQWTIRGYETDDDIEGSDDDPADVFGGIGIYAKPASEDDAEGVLINIGGKADHPTIAAVRNEDARKRYVDEFGDISAGEIAIFNSSGKSRVIIEAGGDIVLEAESGKEIFVRSPGGSTDQLVTKTDFQNHTHLTAPVGPATPPTAIVPPFVYTSVLKAE